MRKHIHLFLVVFSVLGLGACATATPEPVEGMINSGDQIDGMLFSPMDTLDWNYSLYFLCDIDAVEETDTTSRLRCSTLPGGRVFFGNCGGILYETPEEAEKLWRDYKLEVSFDGQAVNLPSFGYVDTEFPEDASKVLRMWNLMVENITLGTHTIQCKQEDEEGTYTGTFVFEVSEKQGSFPALSSGVASRIHPYTTENGEVNYLLYVPDDYGADPQEKWPLLLYLHGRDRVYTDVIALEDNYPLNTLADEGSFPFIVVAPKGKGDYEIWTSDEQVQIAMTALDEVQAGLSVDPDRVYLTGESGGGSGTWVIGVRYPDRFAALAPFMGYYHYPFTVPDNICDLKNVPVWAFHGEADETIPLEAEQSLVDALKACGGDVRFTTFPGVGHDLDPSLVYTPDLYAWLLSHTLADRDRVAPLGEQQVIDIVWQALEPNTSSHNEAAWEIVSVQAVAGREVQDLFEGEPVPGTCVPGPTPSANATIALDGSYWYVEMKPRSATPQPVPTEQFSPTAPPIVPEPFVVQAHFLVDASTGQVVARKIYCVVY